MTTSSTPISRRRPEGAEIVEPDTADPPLADVDADIGVGEIAERVPLEEHLRRTLADLDNLRKRYERELARERADAQARAAAEWLPVVDNLDLAAQHASGDVDDAVLDGLRVIRDQALTILDRLGFSRFEDTGEPFDPLRHEAVASVATNEAPPGTVVAVTRPGYGGDGRILRPAAVVVAKEPEEPD
jgi:molecular chaperone GrpE